MILFVKTILLILFMEGLWLNVVTSKITKHLKKINEELIAVAWHPNDGRIFACHIMKKDD